MDKYKLPPFCKENKDICDCEITCYPYLLFERLREESKIQKKYWNCTPENLPIKEENPITYNHLMRFMESVTDNITEKGISLYLYSISAKENTLGTGVGKTTAASTIANHYLKKRVVEHIKGINKLKTNPVLFLSIPSFQNIYNSQFSGSLESKETSSSVFKNLFNMAIETELLVMDDLAVRNAETFLNFLYEIIDKRTTDMKSIIITSNVPMDKTGELLGDRICSRLQECVPFGFTGKDHRRRSF